MARFDITEWEKSPWYWFIWVLFALAFMVFDLVTGSLFLAGFMAALAVWYTTKIIDILVERREEKLKALKEEETNGI